MRRNHSRTTLRAGLGIMLVGLSLPTVVLAATPGRGDLVFSEIRVKPKYPQYGNYCQWFEMVNLSGASLDLDSCRVGYLPEASVDPTTDFKAATFQDAVLTITQQGEADPILFVGETSTWSMDDAFWPGWMGDSSESEPITPDFTYKGSAFKFPYSDGDEARYTVCLICGANSGNCMEPNGDVVVDEFTYQWTGDLDAGCDEELYPGKCAFQVAFGKLDADLNDNATLSGGDWEFSLYDETYPTFYYTPQEVPDSSTPTDTGVDPWEGVAFYKAQGTPGWQNYSFEAPVYNVPTAAGDLIITEVMADPEATAEWFEITNLSGQSRDLNTCSVNLYKFSDLDTADTAGAESVLDKTYTFTNYEALPVADQASLVLSIDECAHPAQAASGAYGAGETCDWGDLIITLGSLSNSSDFMLELSCPQADGSTLSIDAATFNVGAMDAEDGLSIMLDPSASSPSYQEANDDMENWCTASYHQKVDELCTTDEDDVAHCNWATPGAFVSDAACEDNRTDPDGDPEAVCRCSSTPTPWALAPLMGLLGALGLRRRRS